MTRSKKERASKGRIDRWDKVSKAQKERGKERERERESQHSSFSNWTCASACTMPA